MDKNFNVIIADNLKQIRLSRNWSQRFVAVQLGLSQRTISRIECGKGASQRTLKMLCSLYQVSLSSIYYNYQQEVPKEIQIIPNDVVTGLLMKNSFVQDLEREIILRYTDNIQKEALMVRSDIEKIIPEVLTLKKTYTLQDIIAACMLTNQKTLFNIRQMAIE